MRFVIWKVESKNINIASYRYRCLTPLRWFFETCLNKEMHIVLDQRDSFFFPRETSAMVFVKTFSKKDFDYAQIAKSKNVPIFIDICDNFLGISNQSHNEAHNEAHIKSHAKYEYFNQIAEISTAIVTPTEELKKNLSIGLNLIEDKIFVIPDSIETKGDLTFILNENKIKKDLLLAKIINSAQLLPIKIMRNFCIILFKRISSASNRKLLKTLHDDQGNPPTSSLNQSITAKTKANQRRAPDLAAPINNHVKKILWFGNSGKPGVSGITDILILEKDLLALAKKIDFVLTICSDNEDQYLEYIYKLPIRTQFIKWSLNSIQSCLLDCDCVIIPNPLNRFTIGKSSNRALLALSYNKTVIATKTNALVSISDLIYFDDWESNLTKVLVSKESLLEKHPYEWTKIYNQFSYASSGKSWKKILSFGK